MNSEIDKTSAALKLDLRKYVRQRDDASAALLKALATNAQNAVARLNQTETSAQAASLLVKCVQCILEAKTAPEEEYIKQVQTFFNHLSALTDTGKQPPAMEFVELLNRIDLLHDLMAGVINPTQTAPTRPKMLGTFLIELGFVTQEQLEKALAAQKSGNFPGMRVGDILEHWNIITRAQLDKAIEEQMVESMGM